MSQEFNNTIKKTKKLMSLISEDVLQSPLSGNLKINSPFGDKRTYETHPGVDLYAVSGTDVHSPADGKVIYSDFTNGACGGCIQIEHGSGFVSRYCHIKELRVDKGDEVKKGEIIGLSGGDIKDKGNGNSRGAHLHFELKKDGVLVNPMDYIEKAEVINDPTKSDNNEQELLDKILNSEYNGKKISDIINATGISFLDALKKVLKLAQELN